MSVVTMLMICSLAVVAMMAGRASSAQDDQVRRLHAVRSIDSSVPLKILPLGASIVWGQDSTDGNGFRLDLRNRLYQSGNTNVSYVGTIHHGNMTNNACEAYPGRTIDQVERLALKSGAYDFAPNVILVHLGTNDCGVSSHEVPSTALGNFASLLVSLKQNAGDALVIVSNLIKNRKPAVDQCITQFNAGLPQIVEQATRSGQKVVLIDMHDAIPVRDINATDGTHPTDAGYSVMARQWYHGLKDASAKISRPNESGNATPADSAAGIAPAGPSSILALALAVFAWIMLT